MDRYRSPNCRAGVCQACPHDAAACDCPHHLDGTARIDPARVPDPPSRSWEAEVVTRASALCIASEPHARDELPCVVHRSEARRQLTGAWMGQDNRRASEVA